MTLLVIVIEGALGAGLALLELVAHDSSMARAVAMAVHLLNTLLLVGTITLTAWWGQGGGALILLFPAQIGVGVTNIAPLVPVAVQLIHLLMADLVWIALVLLAASALSEDAPKGARRPPLAVST